MHAIILSGSGGAIQERARTLAAARLCEAPDAPCGHCRHCRKVFQGPFPGIHPDVTLITRQINSAGKLRREITVDQIRALAVDAQVLPNEAAGKVYILPEADAMNTRAQNAFLKLLEEPPAWVTFLLCASNREALLETVRSRCAVERVGREPESADPQAQVRAEGFLDARGDRAELLRCCTAMEKLTSEALLETVERIRALAVRTIDPREVLFLEDFLAEAARYLRANVGVKHVTGYLSTYVYDTK